METPKRKTLFYKRATFVTHLPVEYLYSPAHTWISVEPDGVLRAGLTKFAVRMLGDSVDHGFDTAEGSEVRPGQILGWIEGFKAISDLYCAASGVFLGGNPALTRQVRLAHEKPYDEGWLYAVRGTPDERCLDVAGYRALLDSTIDRILSQQKQTDPSR